MHTSLFKIIFIIQILSAFIIIGLVLLQHGKGADMGITSGSSVSGSLFGVTGSSNFLSKLTGITAILFFIATLTLTFLNNDLHINNRKVIKNFSRSIKFPSKPINSVTTKSLVDNVIDQSNQIPR